MNWRFTILDRNNAATVIDEPPGWDKNNSEIKRDLETHGVFFNNEGENFEFYGPAMRLLQAEYEEYRFQGEMLLIMEEDCGNGFEEFNRGKFDFNKYEFICGDACYVKCPVENSGEIIEFVNRRNQKVNLEALTAFDQTTHLPAYGKLPFQLELPSKGIFMQDKAVFVEPATSHISLSDVTKIEYDTNPSAYNFSWFQVVPQIEKITLDEFGQFATAVTPENQFTAGGFYSDDKAPTLFKVRNGNIATTTDRTLYFDWTSCTPANYNNQNAKNFAVIDKFNLQLNYSTQFDTKNVRILYLNKVVLIRRKDGTYEFLRNIQELSATGNSGSPGGYLTGSYWAPNTSHTVNESFSVNDISLHDGDYLFVFMAGLCQYINTDAVANLDAFDITGIGGDISMTTLSKGRPTQSNVFAINEVISRITESITNNKLKAYSEYFGRTDSQPYAVPADGCGSLAVITDGLRVRRQENKIPGTTNLFSVSLQDVLEGLSPIHNIGMGIEPDTNRPGFNRLRVEPWYYFYNDEVIMSCTNIGELSRKAYEKEAFSTFQFGYAKWEAEEYNGLDEFLTKRTGRTTLSQIKNDLVKLSKWIASGYALEVTRRKGIDTKDWRYDKETFIICCKRNDASDIVVELGNVLDPENIIDPDTIYNYRISPLRNGMRWMNKIFESYRHFGSDCKLIFTDGDGNYFAKGQMESSDCRLENAAISENETLIPEIYADQNDAKPFLAPERVVYDYPMSSRDCKRIKQNPYGLIYFSSDCEEGFGYIDTINYIPEEGKANFNLIPKAM